MTLDNLAERLRLTHRNALIRQARGYALGATMWLSALLPYGCSSGGGKGGDDPVNPCDSYTQEQMDDSNVCTEDYCAEGIVKHDPKAYSTMRNCENPVAECRGNDYVTTPHTVRDACEETNLVLGNCDEETVITDSPECFNEDEDKDDDGIEDIIDDCLNTAVGKAVNSAGCAIDCSQTVTPSPAECTTYTCADGIFEARNDDAFSQTIDCKTYTCENKIKIWTNNTALSNPVDCISNYCAGTNLNVMTLDGATTCVAGELVPYECTIVSTIPNAAECVNPPTCTDADSDSYKREGGLCGAIDCNDTNPLVNPGVAENCATTIDDNCNFQINEGCAVITPCSALVVDDGNYCTTDACTEDAQGNGTVTHTNNNNQVTTPCAPDSCNIDNSYNDRPMQSVQQCSEGVLTQVNDCTPTITPNDPRCTTPNQKPTLDTLIGAITTPEDTSTTINGNNYFSDPEAQPLIFTVLNLTPAQVQSLAHPNGDIDLYANTNYNGTGNGTIKACDPLGLCETTPFTINFTPVNDNPLLSNLIFYTLKEGSVIDGKINFTDVDLPSDDVRCYLINNDGLAELAINQTDCTIYSSVPVAFDRAGTYNIQVMIKDQGGLGQIVLGTFPATVDNTNQVPIISDVSMDIGGAEEGKLLSGGIYGNDPDLDALSCYLISSTLPQAKVNSNGCFIYSDNPLPAGVGGPHTIEVGMTDGTLDDTLSKDYQVQGPPTIPSFTPSILNYAWSDAQLFPLKFDVTGSIDPNGDAIQYKSNDLPAGATLNPTTGHFFWDPTCSQQGGYLVHFYAEDSTGRISNEVLMTINVNDEC